MHKRKTSKRRKTVDYGTFSSDAEGIEWILNGRWVCISGKPVSSGWVSSWSLMTIINRLRSGVMTKCYSADSVLAGLPVPYRG